MEEREMPSMLKYRTTTNNSNYDDSCTLRHFRFTNFKISRRFIFDGLRVRRCVLLTFLAHCLALKTSPYARYESI
jgi:hypothetical protein